MHEHIDFCPIIRIKKYNNDYMKEEEEIVSSNSDKRYFYPTRLSTPTFTQIMKGPSQINHV